MSYASVVVPQPRHEKNTPWSFSLAQRQPPQERESSAPVAHSPLDIEKMYNSASLTESATCRAEYASDDETKIYKLCKLDAQYTATEFEAEIQRAELASNLKIGPQLFKYSIRRDIGFGMLLMQRLDFSLGDFLVAYDAFERRRPATTPTPADIFVKKFKEIDNQTQKKKFENMCKQIRSNFFRLAKVNNGFLHMDLHENNVFFSSEFGLSRPFFIDFGKAHNVSMRLHNSRVLLEPFSVPNVPLGSSTRFIGLADSSGANELILYTVDQAFMYSTQSLFEALKVYVDDEYLSGKCREALYGSYLSVWSKPKSAARLNECFALEAFKLNALDILDVIHEDDDAIVGRQKLFQALHSSNQDTAWFEHVRKEKLDIAQRALGLVKSQGDPYNVVFNYVAAGPMMEEFVAFVDALNQYKDKKNLVLPFIKKKKMLNQEFAAAITLLAEKCFFLESKRQDNRRAKFSF